jgi:magnesium chelatase subunit I
VPDFLAELVERIAFEARADKRVDRRSGVSQRLPISVMENVVSNAERRALRCGEKQTAARVSDVYAAIPSITGKLELEYEGEQQGSDAIARELIRKASGQVFEARVGGANTDDIVHWFDEGGALKVSHDEGSAALLEGLGVVPGLVDLAVNAGLARPKDTPGLVAAAELVLEGLAAQKRIARSDDLGFTRARPERPGPGHPGYGKGTWQ